MQWIVPQKAGNEAVETRVAQIQQSLAATQQRRAASAEGEAADMIDEYIGCQPVRPAAALRAQAEVGLLPVALVEYCSVQTADIVQAVAAHKQTEADPDRNLNARAGVSRCGERVQDGPVFRIDCGALCMRVARDRSTVAQWCDGGQRGPAVGSRAQPRQPVIEDQRVSIQ